MNDHDPRIEFLNMRGETQDEVQIAETAKAGHFVSFISVTDLDLEDRDRLVVTIIEGNQEGHFTLDSVGDIHLLRVSSPAKLDRGTVGQYRISVKAEDQGNPPRTSTATILLDITNKTEEVEGIPYSPTLYSCAAGCPIL